MALVDILQMTGGLIEKTLAERRKREEFWGSPAGMAASAVQSIQQLFDFVPAVQQSIDRMNPLDISPDISLGVTPGYAAPRVYDGPTAADAEYTQGSESAEQRWANFRAQDPIDVMGGLDRFVFRPLDAAAETTRDLAESNPLFPTSMGANLRDIMSGDFGSIGNRLTGGGTFQNIAKSGGDVREFGGYQLEDLNERSGLDKFVTQTVFDPTNVVPVGAAFDFATGGRRLAGLADNISRFGDDAADFAGRAGRLLSDETGAVDLEMISDAGAALGRKTDAGNTMLNRFGMKVGGIADETPLPDTMLRGGDEIIDVRESPEYLTTNQRFMNFMRTKFKFPGALDDPKVQPIMAERTRGYRTAESQAERVRNKAMLVERLFKTDKNGLIDVAGQKLDIRDIAARLPQFVNDLTPAQVSAIRELGEEFSTYWDSAFLYGRDIGQRADVVDGGVYLPRGKPDQDGLDGIVKVGTGRGAKGAKTGSERSAVYASVADGIANGEKYPKLAEAAHEAALGLGRAIADQAAANKFLSLTDDAGELLGKTAKDLVDPNLRAAYEATKRDLLSLRGRLETATRRAGISADAGDELAAMLEGVSKATPENVGSLRGVQGKVDTVAERAARAAEAAKDKGAKIGTQSNSVAAALKRLDEAIPDDVDQLGKLESALGRMRRRTAALRQRGGKYAEQANRLDAELAKVEAKFDEIAPKYRDALGRTPRDRGAIGLAPLNGRTFPDVISSAANKVLEAEGPLKGAGAKPAIQVRAVNGLLRAMGATADVSFMGIQGLIGAATDPKAYGTALGRAWQALADPTASAKAMEAFDAKATARGLPTVREMVIDGLHIGGTASEASFGEAAKGSFAAGVRSLPVARESDRAFGTFGDVLRVNMFGDALEAASKAGVDITNAATRQKLAETVNLATGVSKNRLGGEWGDLAFFAPRFFQAQLEFVAKAFTPGMGADHAYARVALARLLGTGVVTTVAINKARGYDTDIDPNSANFMRLRDVPGGIGDVSVFGPWDSLVKGIIRTPGDKDYLLRTKASPLVGMAYDLISGENFMGDPVNLSSKEGVKNIAIGRAPFSTQDTLENPTQNPLRTLFSLIGTKSSPLSGSEERNKAFEAKYGESYAEADEDKRREFNLANPNLVPKPWNDAARKAQEVQTEAAETQRELEQGVIEGRTSLVSYNDARKANAVYKRGQLSVIYPDKKDFERADKVYGSYLKVFAAAEERADPRTDPTEYAVEVEKGLRAWEESHTATDMRYIQGLPLIHGEGEVEVARQKAMDQLANDGYFDMPKYRGMKSGLEEAEIDRLRAIVSDARADDPKLAEKDFKTAAQYVLGKQMGLPTEQIVDVVLSGRDKYKNPEREEYKDAHPELFLWFDPSRYWEDWQALSGE